MNYEELKSTANEIAERDDADILFFNGTIHRGQDAKLMGICRKRRRRSNVLLVLVTLGGNPDSAYRMARCLQRMYSKVTIFATGHCKSAGTLLAIGAHDLIMSDHAELGPLDIQLSKSDELWQMRSGYTGTEALTVMETRAREMFKSMFLDIKRSVPSVTLKTAMQMASELSGSLYSSLFAQIDPMHLGEAGRELKVATQYGNRLRRISDNIDEDKLVTLVASYPSHTFVIDREEAKDIFTRVREPDELQSRLEEQLEYLARTESSDVYNEYISDEVVPSIETGESHERETADPTSRDSEGRRGVAEEIARTAESGAEVTPITSRADRS